MTEKNVSSGEKQPLRGLGEALIGGPLKDAETLEMWPQVMAWIGQASVREGVCGQEVSELVMHNGFWNRQSRQEGEPRSDCENPYQHDGENRTMSQARASSFETLEPTFSQRRECQCEKQRQQ